MIYCCVYCLHPERRHLPTHRLYKMFVEATDSWDARKWFTDTYFWYCLEKVRMARHDEIQTLAKD